MDDNDPLLSGEHDPEWARRMAAMEKEFARADRRARKPKKVKPARAGRRSRPTVLIVSAVVALMVAGAAVYQHFHHSSSAAVPVMNSPAPVTTEKGGPSARPPTAPPITTAPVTKGADDPFAGSPAAAWPTAEHGLLMPAAASTGVFTATEMAAALALIQRFILTARTDPVVLTQHDLTGLDRMVAEAELTQPHFQDGSRQSIFFPSRLAPGFALSAPVRVNGPVAVTYVPTGRLGSKYLSAEANLVWVYPLVPQGDTVPARTYLVVLHEDLVLATPHLDPTNKGKIYVQSDEYAAGNMDCGYLEQGELALPRIDDPATRPVPSGTVPTGTQVFDPKFDITTVGSTCR